MTNRSRSEHDDDALHVLEHYALDTEGGRLETPLGVVEFERITEELVEFLPPPPARVADIGSGPGRYALWLAQAGYTVVARDLVPTHIESLRTSAAQAGLAIDAATADARELDLDDDSVDAALLLGPLYHLTKRTDRLRALGEIRRILRPGGVAFVAAISRWAAGLHAVLVQRLYRDMSIALDDLIEVERTGELPPLFPGSFAGFCHRPTQLRREVADAGLEVADLLSVEGLAFALPDLDERLASPQDRAVVLDAARRLGRVPELLGLGPHLLVIGRRPTN